MKRKFLYYVLPAIGLISFSSCSDDDNENPDETIIIEDSKPSPAVTPEGFYVVNEDWFGHDNGSVNYIKNDGSIDFRVYRAANPDEKLGVTTQFATIYGDNAYFVSKAGKTLIVADAGTLKAKATSIENISGAGRSFLGINPEKGYIATLKGIDIFNIKTLTAEGSIPEISGETGNMCLVGKYVFAIVRSKGIYIINTETDKVEKLIEDTNCATVVQSKDGKVWIGAKETLIKVNPYTLEIEAKINIADAPISGTWFAWTAGSLCASTQENTLYWAKGASVVKYDIDNNELNTSLYTLGKDEEGKSLEFYAAALRVDPFTDKLVLMVKRSGWGDSGSYNWLHIINNAGTLEKEIAINGDNGLGEEWGTADGRYFWFPAMPFFKDTNEPEILLNQIILKPGERKAISLNDKIVDADNTSASIVKKIFHSITQEAFVSYELKEDSLIATSIAGPGKGQLTIKACSNGKSVEKEIRVDVRD